jgi:hypothetical protein
MRMQVSAKINYYLSFQLILAIEESISIYRDK